MSDLQENTPGHDPIILKYSPTPFSSASWVAIRTEPVSGDFAPMLVETCQGRAQLSDPFFDDFTSLKSAAEKSHAENTVSQAEAGAMHDLHDGDGSGASGDEPRSHDASQSGNAEKAIEEALRAQAAEFEKRLEEAYARGVEEGSSAAKAEADAASKALGESVATTLDDLKAQVAEHARATEEKGADLALQVARKLLSSVAAENREYILAVIREALALVGGAEVKRIRVSPQDFEFLKTATPQSVAGADDASWAFQPDESVRMGCVVVTSAGEVDFDLDKAWERIRGQIVGPKGERNG